MFLGDTLRATSETESDTPDPSPRPGAVSIAGSAAVAESPRAVEAAPVDVVQRPQVQERLTSQIADALVRKLRPAGAIVVIEAEHLCMAMRGIRKPGASTTTSAVRGLLQSSAASRYEALDLILRK